MSTYSYILDKTNKMSFFTDMRVVFDSLKGKQLDYNWLITDIELNQYPDESWFDAPYVWLSGEELSKFVYSNDIQFIWAVFSGFKKDVSLNTGNLCTLPYADGNPGFWIDEPAMQHPLAEVEIVCWDSGYTLLLSKNVEIANNFKSYFEGVKSLNEYNRQ